MAEKKILCPLRGTKCIEDGDIVDDELVGCRFWIHVTGNNPQDGSRVDMHDCAISWMPVLLIENSREQRNTGKEIETLRNEVIPQQYTIGALLGQAVCNKTPPHLPGAPSKQKLVGDENGKNNAN